MSESANRVLNLSEKKRALLELRLRKASLAAESGRISPRRDRASGLAPLSYAQERLWFVDQLAPGSAAYNISLPMRLPGQLDINALERALREIVRRHEIVRTTFRQEGETPVQVIAPTSRLDWAVVDMRERPATEREAEAERVMRTEAGRPFDLAAGPLFRARLVRMTDVENILVLTMHHIITDGWSVSVLVKELESVYVAYREGRDSPLAELPIQYADYAVWQREWLSGEVLEEQLGYWRKQLAGMETLELPTDRSRPALFSGRGHFVQRVLPAELAEKLQAVSKREGVTLFMLLLAGFKALLHRYTGQEDIALGLSVAGRNRVDTEPLIGFFVNMLVLRTKVNDDLPFRELLRQVREVTLGAQAHQDLPFARLVEALQPQRDMSRSPLAQIAVTYQHATQQVQTFADLSVEYLSVHNGTSKFDLSLGISEEPIGPVVALEYNTDLFDHDRIERMAGHYERLLQGVVADPETTVGNLPLLSTAEWQQLVKEWNHTSRPYPQRCIHELFDDQVTQTPEAVAVSYGERTLTYRELAERANRLAHYLQRLGVKPEQLVGICVERSLDMIVGILGILKAGGAYVPLDSSHPKERLAFMLEDTQVRVLLTQQHLREELPACSGTVICLDSDWERIRQESAEPPISGAEPDNLAYVIYTSGSTGNPKGVLIEHRSVSNFIASVRETFEMGMWDRVLQFASLNFDVSVFEIFSALLSGARLILADRETLLTPSALTQLLQTEAVTVADLPPAVMALLSSEAFPALRIVFVGLEAFPGELVTRWATHTRRFFNGYGPTEATVAMTWMECTGQWEHEPPIGRPMPNHQVYILDKHLNPVPIGIPGELHTAGVGLARGYLNRAELTDEKFIANPFGPGRLYKTGDLCRYLPDGNIEFLGRVDHQVKLRGLRIELGEVEAALEQHPAVRQAVVEVREAERGPGEKRLVAYLVCEAERPSVSALREHLGRQLPGYMIPAAYVFLEHFPLTSSGKVDRRALPAPEVGRPELDEAFAAPRTSTEETLANKIFSQVLGLEQIGVHDNFFELGGNSLQATQLVSRVRETFQVDLPLRAIFQASTVASLADTIARTSIERESSALTRLSDRSPLVTLRSEGFQPPLFFVHPSGGSVFCYLDLAHHLDADQPFYAFQAPGLEGEREPYTDIEELVTYYIHAMQQLQPNGPYYLGGWSIGGVIVFEMARRLRNQGHQIALLALLDAPVPERNEVPPDATLLQWFLDDLAALAGKAAPQLDVELAELAREADEALIRIFEHTAVKNILPSGIDSLQIRHRWNVFRTTVRAAWTYQGGAYAGKITLLQAQASPDTSAGWSTFASEGIESHIIPGDHYTILRQPNVKDLAHYLSHCLHTAQQALQANRVQATS